MDAFGQLPGDHELRRLTWRGAILIERDFNFRSRIEIRHQYQSAVWRRRHHMGRLIRKPHRQSWSAVRRMVSALNGHFSARNSSRRFNPLNLFRLIHRLSDSEVYMVTTGCAMSEPPT